MVSEVATVLSSGGGSINLNRRGFLKAGTGAVFASVLGFDAKKACAEAQELKIARTTETPVSCGIIVHAFGDRARNVTPQAVHVEGDPDHPIIVAPCVPRDTR